MSEISSLIREFPFGSFLIIMGIITGIFSVTRAFINRNKPACDCDCCLDEDEIEEDDVEEDEEE